MFYDIVPHPKIYRGLVTVGAVGAAAPTDFSKTDFAPTKFLENLTFDIHFLCKYQYSTFFWSKLITLHPQF